MSGILQGLLASPDFGAGVTFGLLGLSAVGLVGLAWRSVTDGPPIPASSLAAVGAALLALSRVGRAPTWLLVGVGIVITGSAITAWSRAAPLWTTFLVAPGAALIAYHALPGPGWIQHVTFGGAAIGGALSATFGNDRLHWDSGPLLISISAAGIWATLPDTEHALALLGATAPLALAGWPLRWARVGAAGTSGWVALAMWTVASGGTGRSTAIVGGMGSLGVLTLEPMLGILCRRTPAPTPASILSRPEALGLHLLLVLISSRVAGLRRSVLAAIGILVAAYAAAAWLLLARTRVPGASRRDPTSA